MPFRAIASRGPPVKGFRVGATHQMRIQERVKRRLRLSIIRSCYPDHECVRPNIKVIAKVPVQGAICVPTCKVKGQHLGFKHASV